MAAAVAAGENPTADLENPAGFLVLHPDLLLSGTRISGSTRCPRQSILEERFGGSSSDKAVEGTLLHELFQVSLDVCTTHFVNCSSHNKAAPCQLVVPADLRFKRVAVPR